MQQDPPDINPNILVDDNLYFVHPRERIGNIKRNRRNYTLQIYGKKNYRVSE